MSYDKSEFTNETKKSVMERIQTDYNRFKGRTPVNLPYEWEDLKVFRRKPEYEWKNNLKFFRLSIDTNSYDKVKLFSVNDFMSI